MTAKEIYLKTMKFNNLKLLIGLATAVISAILFAILVGIGSLFGGLGWLIGIILWLGGTGLARSLLMQYAGYIVKAGHIAIVTMAVTTNKIPANQFEVAKGLVKERFLTSNIYFAIDGLVSGAVKQIQCIFDKVGGFLDAVPGFDFIVKVVKLFVEISLGYIDECCLGYTFYKQDQSAFKSAADGVVIYAQNWKTVLKNAAKTTAVVIGALVGITLVIFLVLGLLFRQFHWDMTVAFIISALVAYAIKFAYIDSWILVKMMVTYMQVAQNATPAYDLYGKLCDVSVKFKELWEKGMSETQSQPAYAYTGANGAASTAPPPQAASYKPVFCGECGAKNDPDTKFCAGCGAKTTAMC